KMAGSRTAALAVRYPQKERSRLARHFGSHCLVWDARRDQTQFCRCSCRVASLSLSQCAIPPQIDRAPKTLGKLDSTGQRSREKVATMTPTAHLRDRLERVKPTSRGSWLARCPAHNDKTPSLSIRETHDGTVLINCFAGCGASDILNALDLPWRA